MKQEIAEQWAAALRSGKYKQGYDVLRTDTNKFCCLGVLCDLYVKDHPNTIIRLSHDNQCWEYEGLTQHLPEKVMKWADIRTRDGKLLRGDKQSNSVTSLVLLNDHGETFDDIAQIIIDNWTQL